VRQVGYLQRLYRDAARSTGHNKMMGVVLAVGWVPQRIRIWG